MIILAEKLYVTLEQVCIDVLTYDFIMKSKLENLADRNILVEIPAVMLKKGLKKEVVA